MLARVHLKLIDQKTMLVNQLVIFIFKHVANLPKFFHTRFNSKTTRKARQVVQEVCTNHNRSITDQKGEGGLVIARLDNY